MKYFLFFKTCYFQALEDSPLPSWVKKHTRDSPLIVKDPSSNLPPWAERALDDEVFQTNHPSDTGKSR